jgi:hypothetical protein
LSLLITGTSVTYAAGGNGGSDSTTGATAGSSTGSGGVGGGFTANGGSGGSGIVIVRYALTLP